MMLLTFTGWKPGFQAVELIKLLREQAGLGLRPAKDAVDRLLDGEEVTVQITGAVDAVQLVRVASQLGAIVEVNHVESVR